MKQAKPITAEQFADAVEGMEVSSSCNLGDAMILVGKHSSGQKIMVSTAGGKYAEISLG